MKNKFITYLAFSLVSLLAACSDEDTFSSSLAGILTFETDSLKLDTCFSTIPTPHKMFYVYNLSGDGIRIANAKLNHRNQTGFRVNVNGTYLGDANGYQVNDMELRKGDSLRVFVELTSSLNGENIPKLIEDNLIFTLENGLKQTVNLSAWSWDATILENYFVGGNTTTILGNEQGKPIVVYGTLTVDTLATLQITPGTTVYFHNNAGIDVKGTLKIMGEKDNEVIFRCDRFDWMVSNLSYDNNPGQWGGIHLYSCSHDNEINYTDIHGGTTALLCDSTDNADNLKLAIRNSTIHNLQGNGIEAKDCRIIIENTQISNTLGTCLSFCGGEIDINQCTIAQYYPFSRYRGDALYFTNGQNGIPHPLTMNVNNSLIKGYADDVITWSHGGTEDSLTVLFDHCVVRTVPGEDYNYMFKDCYIEDNPEDTLTNPQNSFILFDTKNFFYDFTPLNKTNVVGHANTETSLPIDRKGKERSTTLPDIGCYEIDKTIKEDTEEGE